MPGLTYTTYVQQVAEMAVVQSSDPSFQTILPAMIDYAELRISRDLDLLSTSVSLTGAPYTMTAGDRRLQFPMDIPGVGSFVVSEQINLIIGGTDRVPLLPTTKEFLDAVYGSSAIANRGAPKYYAPLNETLILVGPVPDQNYSCEVVGTVRPLPLSPSNTETFISKYLPDLMIMASMVYISAYQRNFGRQSDDPQMAQSYEGQYMTLLKSAVVEEARKKYEGPGWTSQSPAVVATPTRG